MHTYLQQAPPRVVIHCTQVVEKKWKLRLRRRTPLYHTKISAKTDKEDFSPAVFRLRFEQKLPVA